MATKRAKAAANGFLCPQDVSDVRDYLTDAVAIAEAMVLAGSAAGAEMSGSIIQRLGGLILNSIAKIEQVIADARAEDELFAAEA